MPPTASTPRWGSRGSVWEADHWLYVPMECFFREGGGGVLVRKGISSKVRVSGPNTHARPKLTLNESMWPETLLPPAHDPSAGL